MKGYRLWMAGSEEGGRRGNEKVEKRSRVSGKDRQRRERTEKRDRVE